jgi:delta 1-pyrroline-5-carboxylate dehydrogenase
MVGVSAAILFAAVFVGRLPLSAQQGGQPPGGGGRGGRGPGGPGSFDFSQIIDRMLESMQLTDAERAAAKEAWTVKNTARQTLTDKVSHLREVAENSQSSEADLTKALKEFRDSYVVYAKTVSETDAKLVGKISLRTRARLTGAGVLENGVGFGGGFRFGGGPRRPDGNGGGINPRPGGERGQ